MLHNFVYVNNIYDWFLELELCQKIHIFWILVSLANLPSEKNSRLYFYSYCMKVLIFPYSFYIIGLFHVCMHDSRNWYILICTSLITGNRHLYVCLLAIWIFEFLIYNIWLLFLNLFLREWILSLFGSMVGFHLSFLTYQILPHVFCKK